ncbi:tetratricopeptide repeat protein [Deinococcus sp. KSM4-11]|uniref:tetratricopeptide repeat protein n=1 Tax=Deinococcus sp. KSM4-11 TaxID=2568654 RepID=UPI0010A45CDB|nr:tetratricopeptide repeat protein [Deinococcus sp. KSM4-11]THF87149.1 tetratricopeptide repeat protein [Deinococcus sp. KSM4-11]
MKQSSVCGWRRPSGLLVGCLLLSTAASISVVHGNTDLNSIAAASSLPCLTFQGTGGSLPTGAAPVPAAAATGDLAEAQTQLATLEQELQQMKPGSDEYVQLQGMLQQLKQALGAASAQLPPPIQAGKPTEAKALSVNQALGNLYTSLAYRVSPQAWKEFLTADALQDPAKAKVEALTAVARGRPLAAVATYLKVLEQHPKDADALYNLGSLAAFLNAPNEALALLGASEAAGGPSSTFYPAKAQVLTTRGYALMQLGNSSEAERVLNQAVSLAPELPEAQRNLAAALGNQGKCEASRKALVRGLRRNPTPPPSKPVKTTTSIPPTVPMPPPQGTDIETEVMARDFLDFSRGVVGKWPYFPVIAEPEEKAKLSRLTTAYNDWIHKNEPQLADAERLRDALFDASAYVISLASAPGQQINHRMAVALFAAVSQMYRDPVYAPLFQKQFEADTNYANTEEERLTRLKSKFSASQALLEKDLTACSTAKDQVFCQKKAKYDDMNRQCTDLKDWNHLWQGSISYLETTTRANVTELDRYLSTVSSYISEPRLLRFVQAHHQLMRKLWMGMVPDAINRHLSTLIVYQQPCLFVAGTPTPTPDETVGAYEPPADAGCQPTATLKAKALIFEVSGNCEKVGLEVSGELPWMDIGVFVSVEEQFSAGKQTPPTPKDKFLSSQGIIRPERIPQFGESQGSLSTFGVSVGVKESLGVGGTEVETKQGFYLTSDGKGNLADVGVKLETSASVGAEVDLGVGEIGIGLEFEGPGTSLSFVPSTVVP